MASRHLTMSITKGLLTLGGAAAVLALMATAVVATLVLSDGGHQKGSTDSVAEATGLLEGKRLTAYVNGSTTETTIDRSGDFCPSGRFLYQSNSTFYEGGAFRERQGTWRVVAAEIRRGSGWAHVSWRAGADSGTSKIVVNGHGVTFDGYPVEVTSSAAC
jgi:hypothetical protein